MSEVMPNRSVAHSIERAKSATVRMRVYDATGYGIGTGTIIDARNGEALIITCGHLFRDSNRQTRVEVDLFRGGQCETVIARIIDFDAEVHDIGLVSIRTNQLVDAVRIAGGSQPVRNGETVFSFGCDRGERSPHAMTLESRGSTNTINILVCQTSRLMEHRWTDAVEAGYSMKKVSWWESVMLLITARTLGSMRVPDLSSGN